MAYLAFVLTTLKDRAGDRERGATVVEYALVIGGISIVLVLGAVALNTGLSTVWTEIQTFLGNLIP